MSQAVSRRTLMGGAACGAALATLPLLAVEAHAAPDPRTAFALIEKGIPAAVMIDADADSAVRHVATNFTADLERVSGTAARLTDGASGVAQGPVVIIGVLGHSAVIDRLVAAGKIAAADLHGEWEAFRQIVVDDPMPGVSRALVIVGSDRRGAVFGTYDVSERIGVSPWHWFADVPVRRQRDVLIPAGSRRDQPKVRYRGFFINDEDPCLSGWAKKAFGGVNAAMYVHVFELLLRMKGNYLWPAMWGKAFADDDPASMVLADAMGVVMSNSHHEPMLRAQAEWHRHEDGGVTGGAWDYDKNGANLRKFWRGGIERMMAKGGGQHYDSVVTVGMRGDGDEAMAEGTATGLLERVVADQRQIIADVTGKPATDTPQVWALYKEVQDYYDHGMKVPDDVTLLFSDDNWGQIRRLPDPAAPARKGGYGIYYHFDYVGGPRNYKWINTNQIEKTWQQMDLAYRRGAAQIWIVNVGDIKPMEYPLGFFLAQAWNPDAMTPAAVADYPRAWATATFGPDQARAIGEIVTQYSQYVARRKPELIDQDSFPLGGVNPKGLDGGEFGAMVAQWDALEARMLTVRATLRPDQRDAYYQLVEFPVAAVANLYRMYYGTAWNRLLAAKNDARANYFADQVETAFRRDGELTQRYHSINGGKWDGMMAQVHMSYVIWNDPTKQTMPSIVRVGADTPEAKRRQQPIFVPTPATQAGIVALEAPAFSRARDGKGLRWTTIPHLGRTAGAMIAMPQGRPATLASDGVCLEYDVTVAKAGPATVTLYLVPTLDTFGHDGSRIGVSIDGGAVQVLRAVLEPTGGDTDNIAKARWADAVRDNGVRVSTGLGDVASGRHTIKIWRLDDNMVLQKLVLATIPVPMSYLGAVPVA
ncbi:MULTISPECIES: glycosyl hydrolase 115 family protein [unclassified Sphingomonas]|uniref:glycosyl hydrolase 115 family protein n=1 Tax=unclassified Sphingomonas TaxID=196159 RepID=UPI000FF598C0|nr:MULTISPECIES: glycosyl hydrolase 115 family protein [unclassified Sphingomonas]RKE53796.1 glycosyl hydrolase family 115 (putative glucuronidase) [Sphingomonas sp. PP-CC-1A-547]TCM10291.1 glycosyl hydrolase family 115 (putative glucuronidase) [Sphingomonas sp. PP-CC-3G-468]